MRLRAAIITFVLVALLAIAFYGPQLIAAGQTNCVNESTWEYRDRALRFHYYPGQDGRLLPPGGSCRSDFGPGWQPASKGV